MEPGINWVILDQLAFSPYHMLHWLANQKPRRAHPLISLSERTCRTVLIESLIA